MNKENIMKLFNLIQEIIEILQLSNTSTLFSEWNTVDYAVKHFNSLLDRLLNNDKEVVKELKTIFAPTGSLQEIAISSGWGDKYLYLASEFDNLTRKI